MDEKNSFFVFQVNDTRCALPLENVIRVESAVEISLLPGAPEGIAGIVNVRGRLLPVMDLRVRLKRPIQEMTLNDHLILAKTECREMLLWVGEVFGIQACRLTNKDDFKSVLDSLPHLSGVSLLDDNLILIFDLERFLSAKEEETLTQTLNTIAS